MPDLQTQPIIQQAVDPNMQNQVLQQMYGLAQKQASMPAAQVNTAPMQAAINQEKTLAAQIPNAVPKAPQLETNLPQEPQAPEIQPMEAFSQIAPAMIVLGSLFTRPSGMAAAQAATAAMNSYKQGKVDDYERAREQWKDKTQEMLDHNRQVLDAYKASIDESRGNMDLLQAKMTAVAAQFKDENTLAMLKAGNVEKASENVTKQFDMLSKLSDTMTKAQKSTNVLTDEQYTQYQNDPAMQVALKAYHITGDVRTALGGVGGLRSGNEYRLRAEALQRMANDKWPDWNPAIAQLTNKETAKELTTLAPQREKMSAASNILSSSLPSLIESAKKLGLSESTDWNSVVNMARRKLNDADYKNFSAQLRAVSGDYAMLIGRGSNTVHSDEEALKILNENQNVSSIEGFQRAVTAEESNLSQGYNKTFNDIISRAEGKENTTEKPSYSQEDLEYTAKKNGITVDEVKKRLGVQ